MSDTIEPFTLRVPQSELDDLHRRLTRTRWPEKEPVTDWSQGAPLGKVQALCDYWRDRYDWRRCESLLNGWGQFRTVLDGLGIHFLHVRSPEPGALPLVMTHGWPGSVIEFHKVIGPLTNPVAHGGKSQDAFHLVLPSLPGFGFSDKPAGTGWNLQRIARAWVVLMERLGYGERYGAQGGDWGAGVAAAIGALRPPGCVGLHLNTAMFSPQPEDKNDPSPEVQAAFAAMKHYQDEESGYAIEQSTRPQTLGYALSDSPAGQAAWIYEKFHGWTDHAGDPESVLTPDEMLDNVMLYWLPNAAASSARIYRESFEDASITESIEVPTGVSVFPRDINRAPRRWAERVLRRLIHWHETERGGHFAAFEQPEIFVREVRECFRKIR